MKKLTGKEYVEFKKLHREESMKNLSNLLKEICDYQHPQNIIDICKKTCENKLLSLKECETLNEYLLGLLNKVDVSKTHVVGANVRIDSSLEAVRSIDNLFNCASRFYTEYDCNNGPWDRKILKDSNSRQNLIKLDDLDEPFEQKYLLLYSKCFDIAMTAYHTK